MTPFGHDLDLQSRRIKKRESSRQMTGTVCGEEKTLRKVGAGDASGQNQKRRGAARGTPFEEGFSKARTSKNVFKPFLDSTVTFIIIGGQ